MLYCILFSYFIFVVMMHTFLNPDISIATTEDIGQIKNLLNSAYRGESSKQGWTTEVNLIAGETRANENTLQQVMAKPGSVFLKYINEARQVIGCVNLQQHGNKMYLGMFSVSPQKQGAGIGKQLLQACEEYCSYLQCSAIYMSVISVRSELIEWYTRHGYKDTGERKPFAEDGESGKHLQPLEFMMLEKTIH